MMYADHAATTPLLGEARDAMLPWLDAGNASSMHQQGRKAKAAIDEARELIAQSLGVLFGEVYFTSSGTESANLAILGAAVGNKDPNRNRILMSAAEHHCALHAQPILEKLGYQVQKLRVDQFARVDLNDLADKLGSEVLLVSVMHANNELGSILPIQQVGDLCRQHGALFFCDAVQTFLGKCAPSPIESKADLVAIASHKIYGPKGAAALFVRAGTQIHAVTVGGGQERELRAGTENVAAIIGFAAAVKNFPPNDHDQKLRAAEAFRKLIRDKAVMSLPEHIPSLPGHVHFRIPGRNAEPILIALDRNGICAGSGAACSSGSLEPSHVMLACGYSAQEASEGLRFSFGAQSTVAEASEMARVLNEIASGLSQ